MVCVLIVAGVLIMRVSSWWTDARPSATALRATCASPTSMATMRSTKQSIGKNSANQFLSLSVYRVCMCNSI